MYNAFTHICTITHQTEITRHTDTNTCHTYIRLQTGKNQEDKLLTLRQTVWILEKCNYWVFWVKDNSPTIHQAAQCHCH